MTATQQPSTKQDILNHLLKQGQATAQELADWLDISPQAIRRHLKDLEDEDLIEHQAMQAGMGRPNYTYRLSRKGRAKFPDRYDEFAISLLDTLAETVGKDKVGDILRQQWQRKALEYQQQVGTGSLQERVAKLVELRQVEGYMAEWHPLESHPVESHLVESHSVEPHAVEAIAPTDAPSSYVITEFNCAISHIAESFPSVCGHELEMFEMALQDCTVTRTHWLVNGEHRCGYLIQSKSI